MVGDALTGLPQLGTEVFLTDGGIETDLIFNRGVDLPLFAAFVLHDDLGTEEVLRDYVRDYLRIGASLGYGLVLDTATWRASTDWAVQLGYDAARLREVNQRAVQFLLDLRAHEAGSTVVVSGCVGPRDDPYRVGRPMTPDSAEHYHREQVQVLADAGADLVSALTLTDPAEAIGIARAAAAIGVPVVISFTVETDGALAGGLPLSDAISAVDAATDRGPTYYMVNCAHPEHVARALSGGGASLERVRGVRANASRRSHAELDESDDLDDGDPVEFGQQLADLHARIPTLTVLGGCCGSDSRHIEAVGASLRSA